MITVWKFPLQYTPARQVVELPEGYKLLLFDHQHAVGPCLWASVDDAAPTRRHEVIMVGTGQPVPEGADHLGTVQQGPYVWHYFIRKP